jgi:hypothetical protein
MNIGLQSKLFQRHPKFFRRRRTSSATSIGPIHSWGIECGDGWFPLVDALAGRYEAHIQALIASGVSKRSWPRPSQVKEKFGGLRFYIQNLKHVPNDLVAATQEAEATSMTTCETCGKPGTLRTDGHWRVACDHCVATPSNDGDLDVEAHLQQLKALLASRSL